MYRRSLTIGDLPPYVSSVCIGVAGWVRRASMFSRLFFFTVSARLVGILFGKASPMS